MAYWLIKKLERVEIDYTPYTVEKTLAMHETVKRGELEKFNEGERVLKTAFKWAKQANLGIYISINASARMVKDKSI